MPLQIIRQDIAKMRVDAIVNTTNEEMVRYASFFNIKQYSFVNLFLERLNPRTIQNPPLQSLRGRGWRICCL